MTGQNFRLSIPRPDPDDPDPDLPEDEDPWDGPPDYEGTGGDPK